MAFKPYTTRVLVWMAALAVVAAAKGWSWSEGRFHLAILLGLLLILISVILFRNLVRTTRDIHYFFKSLENDDTSIQFPSDRRNGLIAELYTYLNRLNQGFQEIRLTNEVREQYFSKILENLSSGLLIIAGSGHISQVNEAALRLLNIQKLTHIDALKQVDGKLFNILAGMRNLEQREYAVQSFDGGPKRRLALQAVEIELRGEPVKIVSLQDLSVEMERKEIEDWIRLIRVMSHEIMNSLAPITSISTTLKEVWADSEAPDAEKGDPRISQTLTGLEAIAEQSDGLTTFFESYRVLSRIPDPVIKAFSIGRMFQKLELLTSDLDEREGVTLEFRSDPDNLMLAADEAMITNVLLNLIKNGIQATAESESPKIRIVAERDTHGGILLKVQDNGEGIPVEQTEEIFLPFYTTRERGTGVGLSYSRQVMQLHGGSIGFVSQPGLTEFKMEFPQD